MKHLVTGGARSGKSTFSLREALALAPSGPIGFIATAHALDPEMEDRIRRHRAERDHRFITLEASIDLGGALRDPRPTVFIVDCLTMWCANHLFSSEAPTAATAGRGLAVPPDETQFDLGVAQLLRDLQSCDRPVLLVSNEVGFGIVPADALSRTYQDWLGRLNQRVAAIADRVTLLVAGIPVAIKSPGPPV